MGRPFRVSRRGAATIAVVFVTGLVMAGGLETHAAWAAAAINTAHAMHLSAYSAVPFRRERLVPYTAITVADPNLPAGLHQIRTPGRTGSAWQTGILLFRQGPAPGAIAQAAERSMSTSSGSAADSHPSGAVPAKSAGGTQMAPVVAQARSGQPAAVKVFTDQVVSAPREAIIAVGTSREEVQVGGHLYHYARVLDMRATAYDATRASNGPWTGQRSAIGLPLDYGIVAVDPAVVPLGSRLYVENYGLAVAADTGSAIVGDRIDLFFWDTPRDIAAFGIRSLKVYVLDDPRLPPIPVPKAQQKAG